jgi:hypothetical protein
MKANEKMKVSLESVLLEFRVEAGMPRPGILEIYTQRYPQFARELTDYAVDWLLDEALAVEAHSERASSASSAVVSRAISHLYNGMREREVAKKMPDRTVRSSGHSPFVGLAVPRKREICAQLGIDMSIFARFQNRLIDPATAPRAFLDRFAGLVERSLEDFVAYISGPPMMHAAAEFKAEGKPARPMRKQTFEEAVRASSLDENGKQALLKD